MDRQTIYRRVSKYHEVLAKSVEFDISTCPSVEKLFKSKSLMQKAYVDIREMGFDGRVTDYMAWISTAFMVDRARSLVPKDASIFEWVRIICSQYRQEKSHVKNFVKLWLFYGGFYFLFKAEIGMDPHPSKKRSLSSEEYNEQIKISSFLSAFVFMVSQKAAIDTSNFEQKLDVVFETLFKMQLPK